MAYSPKHCTNSSCLHHTLTGGNFIKKGFFRIARNHQRIRRFQCKSCGKTLSSRSFSPTYYQKKPHLNPMIFQLLCEGMPMRGIARTLKISKNTVTQKFLWLYQHLSSIKLEPQAVLERLYFDELETIEHTKLKPLSVLLFVDETYNILKAQVAVMPAKGRLAKISREKYGPRQDEREEVLEHCFKDLRELKPLEVYSDARPSYRKYVLEVFPGACHKIINRSESEIKRHRDRLHEKYHKKRHDPMFAINQRCAKLRADIRRLTRRSWCTTKLKENLQKHLDLYCFYNNLGRDLALSYFC